MRLKVLGSGTSVPHPRRASPAFWLETSSGTILLDAGPDAAHRMAVEQLDWPNLDAIWISHFHLDHFGGLPPFLFSLKWSPQTQARTKPLKIVGPHGLRNLLESIDSANNYRLFAQKFAITIEETDPSRRFQLLPGIEAAATKTAHNAESLALRLKTSENKTFAYTSDTGFTESLANFVSGVDLLVMECSFRRNKPIATHLELAEAMRVAESGQPGKLVLAHLYPEWDGIDVAGEARQLWKGKVLEAVDGLEIEI